MLSYPPLSFGPSTKRDIPAGEFPAGFDAVGLEFLLQLLDPDPGHVELVLHLPDVGVAEGVSAAVAPQLVLGLEHSAPERQRFTHALSKGVGVRAGELGREGLGQGSCEGDSSGQAYSLVFFSYCEGMWDTKALLCYGSLCGKFILAELSCFEGEVF